MDTMEGRKDNEEIEGGGGRDFQTDTRRRDENIERCSRNCLLVSTSSRKPGRKESGYGRNVARLESKFEISTASKSTRSKRENFTGSLCFKNSNLDWKL